MEVGWDGVMDIGIVGSGVGGGISGGIDSGISRGVGGGIKDMARAGCDWVRVLMVLLLRG